LTEINLCYPYSCHEIEDGNARAGTKGLLRNLTAAADAALVCPSAEAGAAAAPAMATGGGDRPQPNGEPPPVVLLAGDCDHDGATGASAFYETIPWWDMCPLVLRLVPDGGACGVRCVPFGGRSD
jgi:hypothetical protein